MLIIRAAQVAALDAAMLVGFRRRLMAHAREIFPALAGADEETLGSTVDAAVAQARGQGLDAERDVARFVDVVLALGPSFPDDPATAWSRPILESPRRAAADRLDEIYRRLELERPDLAPLWAAWR